MSDVKAHKTNFILNIINDDLEKGMAKIQTRFPPEPNGYLHIGHAKSICLNFGIAADYKADCYLRFDDTNPCTEETEYLDAIKADIQWLGFDWQDHLGFSSAYFDELYQLGIKLIEKGKAYVCSLSADAVRETRGTLKDAGTNSPDRDRAIDESLDLFKRMKTGEFEDGAYTLRAKIDMTSGNMNLRDPALFRIRHAHHHRTGDDWCLYPMYDYAHALSDALEGTTHSLCTLEFADHKPLYDWCVNECDMPHKPRQIEFSRLNLNYTITSKRKLKQLVEEGHVSGWDDPRMPTLSGLRRRGVLPASIQKLCELVGVSRQQSITDMGIFENCIRDDLNHTAERRMAVLKPIKVTLSNYPEDKVETLKLSNHPQNPDLGKRDAAFGRTLFIEQDDFMQDPPPKYHRLAPGKSARLINAYVIECEEVIQDDQGNVVELICKYLPETLAGQKPEDGRKVKGIIHWLSADNATPAEVRVYDRLFNVENPAASDDFVAHINPNALEILPNALIEKSLLNAAPEAHFQFNRLGYFTADKKDHSEKTPVFNRTVTLRDTWNDPTR
jgi:glutaminyl-tRNA synthetase